MAAILKGINAIIFDLGRVLYQIDVPKTEQALKKLSTNPDFVYSLQAQSPIFLEYEKGLIETPEFLATLRKLYGISADDHEIIAAWNALLLGVYPGRLALLQQLKPNYRLFLLSNTNALHYAYFIEACQPLFDLMEQTYFSHKMGKRKPEVEIFAQVIDEQQLNPTQTLFIDDTAGHIEGAKQTGLKTLHLTDPMTLDQLLLN